MNTALKTFTAGEIGKALNVTASAIRQRLMGVAGVAKIVRGKESQAWAVMALPCALREELSRAANARGLRDTEQLLAEPLEPWAAPSPWHTLPEIHRQHAEKLCAALAPVLERQHTLAGPDLMELATNLYRQHFGNDIEPHKLRYVMDRATKRDPGFNQWHRPAIYLDEAAFTAPEMSAPIGRDVHNGLLNVVKGIADKSNPTFDDRRHLFPAAFRHLEQLAILHPSKGEQRTLKNSLVQFLYEHVPGLHRPQAAASGTTDKPLLAVRNLFNRLYQEWIGLERPRSLPADQRAVNSGREGYTHAECEAKILGHAARLRGAEGEVGNVDLAIKILSEKKQICAQCAERFAPGRLSSSARRRITPNCLQVAYLKGPEFVRAIAPTHHCDRSDTEAGDRFVIDDMTPNEMTWDEVDGEIVSGQAQLLATEDYLSRCPLPFFLYFGHPNSRTIIKAVSLVLSEVGLPHGELLTERGVFDNRQLSGARSVKHSLPFRDLQSALESHFKFDALPADMLATMRREELGLRDPAFRLRIQQARSPQAKSIEGSFNNLQKNTSRLPGFAGFNQRNEMPRAMQDFERRVKSGKEHPGNEWLHLSELRKNYEEIMGEIANRPVNGSVHRGRSPFQVWDEGIKRRPLRKLPPEIEALFHTHRIPSIRVQSKGIAIKLNRFDTGFYFNEVTGPLVDRNVAVRINYDTPEYIHVEHPETGQLMKVNRALTKSRTATAEQLAEVRRARRAHINGALGEVGKIKNLFTAYVIRDSMHTPGDLAAGAQIAADAEQHRHDQAAGKRERKKLEIKAAALGATLPDQPRNAKRVNEGLDLEAEGMREIEAMQKLSPKGQP